MIQTTAIKLKNPEPLMVTWDIVRRCNLDCTYCESTRHDTYSKLPTFDNLKKTFDFVKQYTDLYNNKRVDQTITNIDFTGGEPTINPDFWPLLDYIKQTGGFRLSLTTNGTWGPKFTQRILDNFAHATVSWHAEDSLNDRTIENILALHNAGMSLQVNVMLHCDYFEQATLICDMLKEKGIRVNPVPIGDGNMVRKGWFIDADGTNRRTSHEYTEKQQDWFYAWMGEPRKASVATEGTNVGRACCGGRCTQGKVEGEWQEVKLVNNWFKDWYCTVNWYFLHIDQHGGDVFHHQTCQATHTGRGPIGTLYNTQLILDNVSAMLSQTTIAPIICPNQRCGCGMCVPKAKSVDDFKQLWNNVSQLTLSV
jgi:MoaA/NifB/PqqE/SkfB family radical SAM enzyme